ncbi:MAG: hypothetical protein ACLTYN_14505 [Dysosmobacter welbionis]
MVKGVTMATPDPVKRGFFNVHTLLFSWKWGIRNFGARWSLKFKIVPPAAEHLHFKFPIPKFDAGLRIKEAACQLRQAVSFVDV